MIDVKELRIGNHVEINGKTIEMDLRMFHAVLMGFEGYNPKPIPLTEEWLVKFGFRKYSKTFEFEIKGNCTITYCLESTDVVCIMVCEDDEGCGYNTNSITHQSIFNSDHVHQLQNLYYALTSQALKITL